MPLAEIIEDGRTGRLYPVADLAGLASTIRELLENDDKRQRLGSAAKAWVESERTWAAVIAPLPKLYRDLILANSA